jgi:hypothetical protein
MVAAIRVDGLPFGSARVFGIAKNIKEALE